MSGTLDEKNNPITYKSGSISELDEKGQEAFYNEDYQNAIEIYKNILKLRPDLKLNFAKNYIGLALYHTNQYEEAIYQFEELIKSTPQTPEYYLNLSNVYKDLDKLHKVEETLLRAVKNASPDIKVIKELSNLYQDTGQYDKAIKYLQGYGKDLKISLRLSCYYEILVLNSIKGDIAGIHSTIDAIEKAIYEFPANDYPEIKESTMGELALIADKSSQLGKNKEAEVIIDRALKLSPANSSMRTLYKSVDRHLTPLTLFTDLENDIRIPDPIKGPIRNSLFPMEYNKSDLEDDYSEINNFSETNSSILIDSINILRDEYEPLFKLQSKTYESLYNTALRKNTTNVSSSLSGESSNNTTDNGSRVNVGCLIITFIVVVCFYFIGKISI